jgi:hypothetical protein
MILKTLSHELKSPLNGIIQGFPYLKEEVARITED